ncbi:MAG: GH3 auxin-responsive promoter family protein [Mogibacterium sp.]|nr:GH3 auxin-responsive promoter family protein [Mogibacterium sp.]
MSNKKYEISVVTPFHNVDLKMFEAARQSVFNQTLGFDNIQWVIVLHNCEEHYLSEVPALFEGCENVIIPVLNNDAKTPSSPRNYGLSFVDAPYVAFLDGDDSFTPQCLEAVVSEFRNTQSQIICFRREYELERPGLDVLTETIMWNQANERIIVEKGSWDVEKMFNGIFGMVTSKAFDYEFLISNHLLFDETIPYAEDVEFVIKTLVSADRICYLPQLIGYHYFINAESLVQSSDKNGETLVAYASGMAKLFDLCLKYGIESDVVLGLSLQESFFILNSKTTTLEDRKKIRDILAPYVLDSSPLVPNKVRDEDACHLMYYIPREVILNPEDPYAGAHVRGLHDGSYALTQILLKNAATDYGEKYSFKTLKTLDAYRFRVPLNTDATLQPLIALQTNIGEQNILTSSPIQTYFITESGSLLPSTPEHFQQYVDALSDTLSHKKSALFAAMRKDISRTNDKAMVSDVETALIRHMINNYLPSHPEYNTRLSSKRGVYYSYSNDELFIRLMADALLSPDIEQIAAFDTTQIAHAFELLYKKQDAVLDRVSGHDEGRAEEVKRILSESKGRPVARALWPKLERTVAYGAGELYESMRIMKAYTGDVPHNHGHLYSPVALLGKAVTDGSDLFSMDFGMSTNFYELLPVTRDDADNTTLTLSEAKINTPYQLVVTNQAGLYRYVTDHFIYVREIGFASVRFTIY